MGFAAGASVGKWVGSSDGDDVEGISVGSSEGTDVVGFSEGVAVVGSSVGSTEGLGVKMGAALGVNTVGAPLGIEVVGRADGRAVGVSVGDSVGDLHSATDGSVAAARKSRQRPRGRSLVVAVRAARARGWNSKGGGTRRKVLLAEPPTADPLRTLECATSKHTANKLKRAATGTAIDIDIANSGSVSKRMPRPASCTRAPVRQDYDRQVVHVFTGAYGLGRQETSACEAAAHAETIAREKSEGEQLQRYNLRASAIGLQQSILPRLAFPLEAVCQNESTSRAQRLDET